MNLRRAGASLAAAAVAVVLLALPRAARAQVAGDAAWHPSAPPLMQVTDVDALVRTAGAQVPRDALFAAYERYLEAWRTSADRWGQRVAEADAAWAAGGGRVFGTVEGGAAHAEILRRSAAERSALEGALFAELALAVPEADREVVRRALARRELRLLLEGVELGSGEELLWRLVACDLDTAIDDALRGDPSARAAAQEAIAPFAARRIAAAQDAAQAQRREPLLRAQWAAANGWGELTNEDVMRLRRESARAEEGAAEASERAAESEAAGTRLNALYRAYESAAEAAAAPARPAHLALARAQLQACRAALMSVAPEVRWTLLRRIFRDTMPGAAEDVLPMELVEPLQAGEVSAACEECVHRALDRWRADGVNLYLEQLGRAVEALGKPAESDEQGLDVVVEAAERERSERVERLLADCRPLCAGGAAAGTDGDDAAEDDRRRVWARLERIPEFAVFARFQRRMAESSESAGGEAEPGGASPYDFWTWTAGVPDAWGDAASPRWLRDTLATLGVDDARLEAVEAIASDHAERWARVRMDASDASDAAIPEESWASPEVLPAVQRADAEGRKALAAEDASLLAAMDAALGDAVSEPDRALLAMARTLGDARRESTARPRGDQAVQSLRANPAEVVLAAELGPQSRALAAGVLLGRAPVLSAALAAARTAHARASACGSTGWRGTSRRTPPEERMARRAAIEAETVAALERERACRAEFDDAIEAACSAVPGEDAARIRAAADRRRYPDAHRPEASLRALWGAVDAQLPPEQSELRVAVAALFDRMVARAEGVCRESIRRAAEIDRRLPISASHAERRHAETLAALGSFQAEVLALRRLSMERIRHAVPAEIRARCRDWALFGRAVDARWEDPDLDSVP